MSFSVKTRMFLWGVDKLSDERLASTLEVLIRDAVVDSKLPPERARRLLEIAVAAGQRVLAEPWEAA